MCPCVLLFMLSACQLSVSCQCLCVSVCDNRCFSETCYSVLKSIILLPFQCHSFSVIMDRIVFVIRNTRTAEPFGTEFCVISDDTAEYIYTVLCVKMSNVKFHFDPITPAASICWYWQGWSYAKLQAAVWHTSCVHLVLVAELAVIIIVWSRRANYSHFSTLSPFKAYYYYYGNIKWDWSCRFFSCLLTNVRKIEIKYEQNFDPNQLCTSHATEQEKEWPLQLIVDTNQILNIKTVTHTYLSKAFYVLPVSEFFCFQNDFNINTVRICIMYLQDSQVRRTVWA